LSIDKFKEFMSTLEVVLPETSGQFHDSGYMKLEPSKKTIITKAYNIMMNVIIYGAVLHNKTGEFAARMLAMK
jgi:F0F1-type ATP synthase gamma subunit